MTQTLILNQAVLRLGRGRDNDIVVDDGQVSRHHAELRRADDGWVLCDLGSTNGSFVNGRRITRQSLHAGDKLQIGAAEMTLEQGRLLLPDGVLVATKAAPPDPSPVPVPQSANRTPMVFAVAVVGVVLLLVAILGQSTLAPGGNSVAQRVALLLSDPTPVPTESQALAAPDLAATRNLSAAGRPVVGAQTTDGTSQSAPKAIQLLAPVNSAGVSGSVAFAWGATAALQPGHVYDVRVCRGSDCQPTRGRTNTRQSQWTWCPDEGEGEYSWQVVVIDDATKAMAGPASPEQRFVWSGGCGVGSEHDNERPAVKQDQPTNPPPDPSGNDKPPAILP